MDYELSRTAPTYQSAANPANAGIEHENNDVALSLSRSIPRSAVNLGANRQLELELTTTSASTPEASKLNDADKDKLVEELKASMDFCKQAFSKLTDSTLGDSVPWFGGRQVSRFAAALEVTNDLIDHYGALAVYLRLNGLLPPTAQRK
jgi:hypothetical protein